MSPTCRLWYAKSNVKSCLIMIFLFIGIKRHIVQLALVTVVIVRKKGAMYFQAFRQTARAVRQADVQLRWLPNLYPCAIVPFYSNRIATWSDGHKNTSNIQMSHKLLLLSKPTGELQTNGVLGHKCYRSCRCLAWRTRYRDRTRSYAGALSEAPCTCFQRRTGTCPSDQSWPSAHRCCLG